MARDNPPDDILELAHRRGEIFSRDCPAVDLDLAGIGDDVDRQTSMDCTDAQRRMPDEWVDTFGETWPELPTKVCQQIDHRIDSVDSKLGPGAVRGSTACPQAPADTALMGDRNRERSGLADDRRFCRWSSGSQAMDAPRLVLFIDRGRQDDRPWRLQPTLNKYSQSEKHG